MLADRLSADPATRVLLIEAGSDGRDASVRVPALMGRLLGGALDWAYLTAPQHELGGRLLRWPLGRGLGGTSLINGQVYSRGDRSDYDEWAGLGNDGWGYEAVLPYFRRAEDNERGRSGFHGTGGPLHVADLRDPSPLSRRFVDACEERGVHRNEDFNGAQLAGAGLVQVTQRRGLRCSARDAYLKPALGRPNLTVVTDALATRILFSGRRARGVEYLRAGERQVADAGIEVIVSCGAVASPHLLLRSGVGPAAHLGAHGVAVEADVAGVGRNLQDHFGVPVMMTATLPSLVAAESVGQILRFVLARRGMLTSNVAEAAAFVSVAPGATAPDLELVFGPIAVPPQRLFRSTRSWVAGRVGPALGRRATGRLTPPRHGVVVGAVVLRPRSVGSVELASADPLAPPVIDPGYLRGAGRTDLPLLVEGVRLARSVCGAPALAAVLGEELHPGAGVVSDDDLEAFVRRRLETTHHPVGTCRMGVDPLAVVDPCLRVHGVDGLRVVDASVMPVIIRGHTNAPTMMIAERAADLILGAVPPAA